MVHLFFSRLKVACATRHGKSHDKTHQSSPQPVLRTKSDKAAKKIFITLSAAGAAHITQNPANTAPSLH
ncbi:uncharacterized protein N7458_006471 [Penicillium daleae]|uniref:Uncharacterized protein n=1 Tax=Penicillium daleae TaxID=63821 RepID=A0AAD6C5I1_9EURO|nr:uncharacterized protein N7458_006471 [Penicillium daleae]KAJ5450022.1 hypothetical protein N7458_006471 [Penicillium daleae]